MLNIIGGGLSISICAKLLEKKEIKMIGELKVRLQVPTWEKQNHCNSSSLSYTTVVIM